MSSTRISSRYALYILALLVLLTPFAMLHTFDLYLVDDCRDADLLSPDVTAWRSAEYVADSPDLRTRYLSYSAIGHRWAEGTVPVDGSKAHLDFVILRSYYPRRLYLRPAHSMLLRPIDRTYVEWTDDAGVRIPLHRAAFASDKGEDIAAWLLVFDSKAVANPYLTQLIDAPRQLFFGRPPMTLFFVSGKVPTRRYDEAEQAARHWLVDSFQRYQQTCNAAPS